MAKTKTRSVGRQRIKRTHDSAESRLGWARDHGVMSHTEEYAGYGHPRHIKHMPRTSKAKRTVRAVKYKIKGIFR